MNEKNNVKINSTSKKISEEDVKMYLIERFTDVKKSKKIKNLVRFQSMNKYMLMAHDQEELKIMGNLVASYKKKKFSEILEEYEEHLKASLENSPTIKKHINVIMHIFGHFSKKFESHEKEKFFHMINKFKEEKTELGEILAEINSIVFKFNNTYLASQTYFLLYSNPQYELLYNSLNIKIP